jgi:hypothetical protein
MTEKLRASKIAIEIPKPDSEPWVHITVNKMFYNDSGDLISNVPRFDYISKPLSQIGMDMYTFMDPVLQSNSTVSGYGLAEAITSYVDLVLKDKYGSEVNND